METSAEPKLFMVLLGSKAPDRNVEQHDYYFGIAHHIRDLVPELQQFWPEAGSSLHIDGWREINFVENYHITVMPRNAENPLPQKRLFFINLGGYEANKLSETHHVMLTVQDDRMPAIKESMKTIFYKTNSLKGAHAHIDEKYGVDVDDVYRIEDVLPARYKQEYDIVISEALEHREDHIHLGYFKLHKL